MIFIGMILLFVGFMAPLYGGENNNSKVIKAHVERLTLGSITYAGKDTLDFYKKHGIEVKENEPFIKLDYPSYQFLKLDSLNNSYYEDSVIECNNVPVRFLCANNNLEANECKKKEETLFEFTKNDSKIKVILASDTTDLRPERLLDLFKNKASWYCQDEQYLIDQKLIDLNSANKHGANGYCKLEENSPSTKQEQVVKQEQQYSFATKFIFGGSILLIAVYALYKKFYHVVV